jgi:hypothetical protein
MKTSFHFLIIFALTIYQHDCKVNQTEVVAAISEILRNFYIANDRRVDILCFECDKNLLEMVNHITKCHQREKISFRTISRNRTSWEKKENRILANSTIAMFRNYKDFSFFSQKAIYKDLFASNNPYHVIYIRDKMKIDFPFKYSYINNNYLVGNGEGKQLTLETFMIIPKKCPMEITTSQWENSTFFPQKFNNLNRCIYSYGILNKKNSVYWKRDKSTNKTHLAGPLYEIHRAITDKLNINAFYYNCQSPDPDSKVKCIVEGSFKPVITAMIDSRYIHSSATMNYTNLQFFDFRYHLGLFIPPGKQ